MGPPPSGSRGSGPAALWVAVEPRYHLVMKRDISSPSEWARGYLSGLVCGEGNFTVAVVKASTCRLGFHVRPIFQIELGMVDEPLIRAVREFFGFGCVSFPTPRTRAKNGSSTVR